jgi:hypothetical protein
MEAYNTADAACSLAVKQFIGGWIARHGRGRCRLQQLNSGIADMAKAVTEGMPLDAIWIAVERHAQHLRLRGALPDNPWAFHQRIHQHRGGHDETWGGS